MWLWLWLEIVSCCQKFREFSWRRVYLSCYRELWRVRKMAVEGDWEEMARKKNRLCKEDFICGLMLQWDGYKCVARISLVKAENPSAYVTMNCKVCKSALAMYVLPLVPSCECIRCNKSHPPIQHPSCKSRNPPTHENIILKVKLFWDYQKW
jgi:hypothetical protein